MACPAKKQSGVQPVIATTQPAPVAKKHELVFPEEAFRATQPAPGPLHDFHLPGIQRFSLANSIEVYLVEQHDVPTITMDLNFNGGSAQDLKGHQGLAQVCMSLMSEGTQKLDKLAFEEAMANLASSVSSYAGTETQGVGLRTLSKNFDATFALFQDTLQTPGYREADLKRLVARFVTSLKQRKGSAGMVAYLVGKSIAMGRKHPFAQVMTEESLANIP